MLWSQEEIDAMDLNDSAAHADAQKSGKRRHAAELAVVQLAGPLQPILLLGPASNHHPLGVGHNLRI